MAWLLAVEQVSHPAAAIAAAISRGPTKRGYPEIPVLVELRVPSMWQMARSALDTHGSMSATIGVKSQPGPGRYSLAVRTSVVWGMMSPAAAIVNARIGDGCDAAGRAKVTITMT